jgi:DNA modification methylase
MEINKIYTGDNRTILKTFEDKSVNCIVTSPPYYGLRDYGNEAQIGLEETPEAYISTMVEVFTECKRVLKDEGTPDSYAGTVISTNGSENWQPIYGNKGKPMV